MRSPPAPNNLRCKTNYLVGNIGMGRHPSSKKSSSLNIDEPIRQRDTIDLDPYWHWQCNIYIYVCVCNSARTTCGRVASSHCRRTHESWWSCAPTTHPLSRKLLSLQPQCDAPTYISGAAAWCGALHIHSNMPTSIRLIDYDRHNIKKGDCIICQGRTKKGFADWN